MSLSAPTVLDGSVDRAEVTELHAWMEYRFRIIATNEYGSGEASIPSLMIKTWDAGKERGRQLHQIGQTETTYLKQPFTTTFFFIVPVVSATDVAGYGGRNGEIVITWTVNEPSL